jgi:hypothetical protein
MLTLLASSDAVAPATDVSVVTALRAGTVVQLDVDPPLDIQPTWALSSGRAAPECPRSSGPSTSCERTSPPLSD